ncbi:DNA-directed RNA polymerase subunit P [Candidatus Micrarchaeota archaeon]|nr:DNA-directed RNA polymerase subunit P [Candidatus Micrarchaeota archaeon]MBI5177201.1 DNA-directed RNA polymerase subunit P [Candidatus Micrarchaeota archaeon]
MASYVCWKCRKKFDSAEIATGIRCPYCGNKILFKETPPVLKKISTD